MEPFEDVIHRLVQGIQNDRSQWLCHITNAQPDYLLVRMGCLIFSLFSSYRGKQIASRQLQIILIHLKHNIPRFCTVLIFCCPSTSFQYRLLFREGVLPSEIASFSSDPLPLRTSRSGTKFARKYIGLIKDRRDVRVPPRKRNLLGNTLSKQQI